MTDSVKPNFHQIEEMKQDVSWTNFLRIMKEFAREVSRNFGRLIDQEYSSGNITNVFVTEVQNTSTGFITYGAASSGLRVGALAYPIGGAWTVANPNTAGAWARGAVLDINAGNATILLHGPIQLLSADSSITLGTVVYPSESVAGAVTATLPDPTVSKFLQEIGETVGPVSGGRVPVFMQRRIPADVF